MNAVATIQNPRPALVAGARPVAIVPTSMDEAYRLATAVCEAGMAPSGLNSPAKAMIAIMQGLEVGLTPMAAMQRIAVVNGRATIWGDAAMGLVRASGLCEWVRERIDGQGDQRVAICETKRKGDPETISGRFSVADAKRAGLWDKAGPWKQYPDRMLQMRARAFALRDGFADVLGGMYVREEADDMREHNDVPPPSPPSPPSPETARLATPTPAASMEPPSPPAVAPTFGEILQSVIRRLVSSSTKEALDAAWTETEADRRKLPSDMRAKAQEAANSRLAEIVAPAPGPREGHGSRAESDPQAWVADCEQRMAGCAYLEALRELWECVIAPESESAFPGDLAEVRAAFDRHEARLAE
ncbi:hypothetical protein ACIKT0_01690 [Hansschlegelia beijingensis]|uniref:hypothetical protein n=1 Tax=Hansschlegelia beijingensis TaxID=1133344 RepID=UPI00387F20E3